MPKFTSLVMAYYDNPNMLVRHCEEWLTWSPYVCERLKVVVVDDGSSDSPAIDVFRRYTKALTQHGVEHELYRIDIDIPWNQDGARNLGMKHCSTPFALMTDMDHLLPTDCAENMVACVDSDSVAPNTYWMPLQWTTDGQEVPPHPNTFLFSVDEFWRMGGYDEDFAGHYGSDGNFRKCAKGSGLREISTRAFGLVVYRREDIADANTRRYGRKDTPFWAALDPRLNAKRKGPAYKAINPIRFKWAREAL